MTSGISSGAAWSLAGTLLFRGLVLASSWGIARTIGISAFGALGVAQSTHLFVESVLGVALGIALTKLVAQARHSGAERLSSIMAAARRVSFLAGAVAAGGLLILAPAIARALETPELTTPLRIGALGVYFSIAGAGQLAVLSGLRSFRSIALVNGLNGLLTFALALPGAHLLGLEGAILGAGLSGASAYAFGSHLLRRAADAEGVDARAPAEAHDTRAVLTTAAPSLLASSLFSAGPWVAMLVFLETGGDYAELGLFKAANQWRMAISYVPLAAGAALLPVLAELSAQRNNLEYARLIRRNAIGTSFFAVALSAPVLLLSDKLMGFYGPEFGGRGTALSLLLAAAVLATPAVTLNRALIGQGRLWKAAIVQGVWSTTLVGATLRFGACGADGLALAYVFAYAVQLGISINLVARILRPAGGASPSHT